MKKNQLLKNFSGIFSIALGVFSTIPAVVSRYRIKLHPFWDAEVYAKAVEAVKAGLDPYYYDQSLQIYPVYPYHPYVLEFMIFVDKFVGIDYGLVFFYVLASFFFFRELSLRYAPIDVTTNKFVAKCKQVLFLLLLFLIGGSSLIAVSSGNISIYLHFLLVATFFRVVRLNKSLNSFALLCVLAAMVKPYLLAYLLLIYIYSIDVKKAINVVIFFLFTWIAIYVSGNYFDAQGFNSHISAARYLTYENGDWGFSFFGILRRRLGQNLALLAHLVILLLALAFTLFLKFKKNLNPVQLLSFFPLVSYFIVCLNPRMKEYDFGILIFLSFASIYFLNQVRAFALVSVVSILLFIRYALTKVDSNIGINFSDSVLYLKYWEVLISVIFVLTSLVMNYRRLYTALA
jgi:hypothetical protein